jgi:CheY-like chemotaxis protein
VNSIAQLYEDEEAKTEAKLLCDIMVVDDSDINCIIAQHMLEGLGLKVITPIVALTADAFYENRKKCKKAGMDDFLSKPMMQDVLLDVLQRWIKPR